PFALSPSRPVTQSPRRRIGQHSEGQVLQRAVGHDQQPFAREAVRQKFRGAISSDFPFAILDLSLAIAPQIALRHPAMENEKSKMEYEKWKDLKAFASLLICCCAFRDTARRAPSSNRVRPWRARRPALRLSLRWSGRRRTSSRRRGCIAGLAWPIG